MTELDEALQKFIASAPERKPFTRFLLAFLGFAAFAGFCIFAFLYTR